MSVSSEKECALPSKTFTLPNILGDIDEDSSIAENALRQIAGVSHVEFNSSTKHVTIEWDEPTSWDDIRRNLEELGYRIDP
jgi:hypothetical protein